MAMGRATVRQPAAFLMDEPLSNLDAKLRVQMRAEITALHRDLAVTTVYVTHDLVEAMTMSDGVAVLDDGYLQQVDTPQNLSGRPDNVFVGAFIGSPSMNLYEGSVAHDGDGGIVTFGAHSFAPSPQSLINNPALRSYDRKPVIIGIRPEDFEDASMVTDDGPENLRLNSKVTLIEALGSQIMVHFRLDAKTVDPDAVKESTSATAANAVGRFDQRSPARIGKQVELALSAENVRFFDATTRLAIRD